MPALASTHPATLVAALERLGGIVDRGYTFVRGDGTERPVTFAELRDLAVSYDRGLRAHGVAPGDRVALVLPDAEHFVPMFLGAVRGGTVPVPLYPPNPFGRLLDYVEHITRMLQVADPVVVVTTARMQGPFRGLIGMIPSLRAVVTPEELALEGESEPEAHPADPDEPVFLQFTSGSTATPRGVVVTHRSLSANASAILHDALQVREDDLGLSWLPLYHDMGLIGFCLAPIFLPTPVVFLPTLSFLRDPTSWLTEIGRRRATITFAPNFAFGLVRKRAAERGGDSTWDLSSVRVMGCGAEPINPVTIEAFFRTFAANGLRPTTFLPCYGMAEATLAMTVPAPESALVVDLLNESAYEHERFARRADSGYAVVGCGRPIPGHEVAVLDEAGRPLPDRHIGQIGFRGPSVAAGYFRDEDATARVFTAEWLLTGDLGYQSGQDLFVTGRVKDLLVIRGRNTDPQQVEWTVEKVPGVRPGSVVAFTRPGDDTEELVLTLETSPNAITAEVVHGVVRRVAATLQLAVADVVVVERGDLPKTSSGKVQRALVRERYLAGIGRSREETLLAAANL